MQVQRGQLIPTLLQGAPVITAARVQPVFVLLASQNRGHPKSMMGPCLQAGWEPRKHTLCKVVWPSDPKIHPLATNECENYRRFLVADSLQQIPKQLF